MKELNAYAWIAIIAIGIIINLLLLGDESDSDKADCVDYCTEKFVDEDQYSDCLAQCFR